MVEKNSTRHNKYNRCIVLMQLEKDRSKKLINTDDIFARSCTKVNKKES